MASSLYSPADDLPKFTKPTVTGIIIAITGNVLISLAMNLQKLAHKRVEATTSVVKKVTGNADRGAEFPLLHSQESLSTPTSATTETQPLIPLPITTTQYGSSGSRITCIPSSLQNSFSNQRQHSSSNLIPSGLRRSHHLFSATAIAENPARFSVSEVHEGDVTGSHHGRNLSVIEDGNETIYLKSKLWWFGFLLMNVGEMGNFISYAWAPASIVAPLGTFSLIANCIFAPLLLNERFRSRDILGVFIAIIGAVTVVIATNPSEAHLDPETLLQAVAQKAFIIYSCVYILGAITLAGLSESDVGRRWVFVDVGMCALFGGFTVLSTKAISTLLTMERMQIFTQWITYPVLTVLVFTGIGQVRYLNRALMRFDSKVVIPVQFVSFTLSAIIGSAILYGDFKKATFHQIITFLYGCAATFLGVFVIARSPSQDGDIDNIHEGIEPTNASNSLPTSISDERRIPAASAERHQISNRKRTFSVPRSPQLNLIALSPAQARSSAFAIYPT